jgi:hypothetical protein
VINETAHDENTRETDARTTTWISLGPGAWAGRPSP